MRRKEWTTLVANGMRFNRYKINKNGVIKDLQTGNYVKLISKNEAGYRVNVLDEYYENHIISLHRAIYESFSGVIAPDNVIHFIDGNKENLNWSNLVSLSYSDHNKMHKKEIAQRDRTAKPIILIDLITQEEKYFESIAKCCRYLGNTYNIAEVLRGNRATFGNKRYSARYADKKMIPAKWYSKQEELRKI